MSDIIVRMAADDIRHLSEAAAHGMSVNVWSAFLAETRFRAKIATWVARFGRDLPSHHVVHGRGFGGCVEDPGASNGRIGQPRGAEIESLNIACLLHLSGQIVLIPQLRALKQLKCSSHNTLPVPIRQRFSASAGGCNSSFPNILDCMVAPIALKLPARTHGRSPQIGPTRLSAGLVWLFGQACSCFLSLLWIWKRELAVLSAGHGRRRRRRGAQRRRARGPLARAAHARNAKRPDNAREAQLRDCRRECSV